MKFCEDCWNKRFFFYHFVQKYENEKNWHCRKTELRFCGHPMIILQLPFDILRVWFSWNYFLSPMRVFIPFHFLTAPPFHRIVKNNLVVAVQDFCGTWLFFLFQIFKGVQIKFTSYSQIVNLIYTVSVILNVNSITISEIEKKYRSYKSRLKVWFDQ